MSNGQFGFLVGVLLVWLIWATVRMVHHGANATATATIAVATGSSHRLRMILCPSRVIPERKVAAGPQSRDHV